MSSPLIVQKLATSLELYRLHSSDEEEWRLSSSYRKAGSLLDSGWDYEWVSSNVAGAVSQLERNGQIDNFGCLSEVGSFCFVSNEILKTFFQDPRKSTLFLGHLFLMQDLLEFCVDQLR